MTEAEAVTIGRLVLEQNHLEKQIASLRDELARRAAIFARIGQLLVLQPERLVFEGEIVGEAFAGERAIDRKAMELDSMIEELRAAIVRKNACAHELAQMGIDPEESERRELERKSRALFLEKTGPPGKDEPKRAAMGFAAHVRKKS